jgi:hypothetical protein
MMIAILILAGLVYAWLTLWACGDYMSSSVRSALPGVLKVLAMPGMLCVYAVAISAGFVMRPFRRRLRR